MLEIAAAFVLLASAGVLGRSVWGLLRVDPGFRTEGVLTARLAPPFSPGGDLEGDELMRWYASDRARAASLFARLQERLAARPGVRGVAAVNRLPMTGNWMTRWGARADYVHTTGFLADPSDTAIPFPDDLQQDDTLYAFYLMNDVRLTDALTASVGFGQAQRPPTLVERYAEHGGRHGDVVVVGVVDAVALEVHAVALLAVGEEPLRRRRRRTQRE